MKNPRDGRLLLAFLSLRVDGVHRILTLHQFGAGLENG